MVNTENFEHHAENQEGKATWGQAETPLLFGRADKMAFRLDQGSQNLKPKRLIMNCVRKRLYRETYAGWGKSVSSKKETTENQKSKTNTGVVVS